MDFIVPIMVNLHYSHDVQFIINHNHILIDLETFLVNKKTQVLIHEHRLILQLHFYMFQQMKKISDLLNQISLIIIPLPHLKMALILLNNEILLQDLNNDFHNEIMVLY